MGAFGKLKSWLNKSDEDQYFSDQKEETEETVDETDEYLDEIEDYEDDYEDTSDSYSYSRRSNYSSRYDSSVNNISSLYSRTDEKQVKNQVIIEFMPVVYDDVKRIADAMLEGKQVVVNFKKAPKATKTRLLVFCLGVLYSNKGSFKRLSNNIYIFMPANYDYQNGDDLAYQESYDDEYMFTSEEDGYDDYDEMSS